MSGLPGRSEVVVVGGGVVGLSVAYELARRGREVLVLDRDDARGCRDACGGGHARADLGGRPHGAGARRARARQPRPLSRSSSPGIEGLTGQSCGYRTEGTLWVALNRDQDGDLERLFAMQRAQGPRGAAADGGGGAGAGAASVRPDRRGAPRRGGPPGRPPGPRAGPRDRARRASGDAWSTGCRVTRIEHGRGAGRGRLRDGRGPRLPRAVRGRRPGRRRLERGGRRAGAAARASAGQGPAGAARRAGAGPPRRPLAGRLPRPAAGRGAARRARRWRSRGSTPSRRPGAVLDLLREAWRLLPGHLRPGGDRAVGRLPAGGPRSPAGDRRRPPTRGLYVATGHFRNGVLLAPATAHHLAEWIVRRRGPGGARPVRRRAAGGVGRRRRRGAPRVSGTAVPAAVELWVNGERRRVAAANVRALLGRSGPRPGGSRPRGRAERRDRSPGCLGDDGARAGRSDRDRRRGAGRMTRNDGGSLGARRTVARLAPPARERRATRAARCCWTRSRRRAPSS